MEKKPTWKLISGTLPSKNNAFFVRILIEIRSLWGGAILIFTLFSMINDISLHFL